jgi:photosystem II stability/assembly factor-like uncharacterized protein
MRFFKIAIPVIIGSITLALSLSQGQQRRADISGIWRSNIGQVYVIEVQGNRFTWHAEALGQNATGTIDGNRLTAAWEAGRQRQSVTGKVVAVNDAGRALRIEWSNRVVFFRDGEGGSQQGREEPPPAVGERGGDLPPGEEGFRPEEEFHPDEGFRSDEDSRRGDDFNPDEAFRDDNEFRPGELPDVSGPWFSNKGQPLSIHQNRREFRIVYTDSEAAFLGHLEGEPPGFVLTANFENQPVEGHVLETDPRGRALLIEWSNGMVFGREPFGEESGFHGERHTGEPGEEPPRESPPGGHFDGPDISGTWGSTVKRTYEVTQNGRAFNWTVQGTNEKAAGVIEGDHLTVEWSGGVGQGHAEGHIAGVDETGRAVEIQWSNGVVFNRTGGAADQSQPQSSPAVKAKITQTAVDIKPVRISNEALKLLIPHLSLKSVYNEWVKVGGPIGGLGYDVRFLSNSEQGKKTMFVTDNYSGVNKSVDGGANWFASNTGIPDRAKTGDSGDAIPVFSLTVDPNNPTTVWIGLKDKKGVYKSTDAGNTWIDLTQNLHIPEQQFVFRGFTIMPGDSNTVFAQGEIPTNEDGLSFNKVRGRIYVTYDGGKSWTTLWNGKDLVRYVIINPQNKQIVFASCGIFDREASNSNCKALAGIQNLQNSWAARGGVGILRSKNGGRTWQELNRSNGLNDLYVGSLVMHPRNPDVLLAGCGNNAASPYKVAGKTHYTGGVFRTENGGDAWTQTLKDEIITSVEFAPSNPDIAYAGGRQHFYSSADGGKTWRMVSGSNQPWGPPGVIAGFPIDILVDPDDPNILFVNNYGGGNVKSTDGGKTWRLASQGYTGALMYDIALDPGNSDIVFAAARSGLFVTKNAGIGWQGLSSPQVLFPESYSVAVNPKNRNIVIASQEMGGIVARSLDGGKNWVQVLQLPAILGHPTEAYGFKRIVFAPSAPNFVYGATCRAHNKLEDYPTAFGVYKSDKDGAPNSWVEANDTSMKNQAVNDLAVHPKNHNVVYAATVKGGLFKTMDGGKVWKAVAVFAGKDVRSVAVDPVDPRTVYAGLQYGGVYRSTDDGNNWHRMAAGINENQMVWALVVNPVDRTVWAGTRRSGVYRWDSIEQQWTPVNKGLSTRAVFDLEISTDGRALYASTTGEGVFRYEKK